MELNQEQWNTVGQLVAILHGIPKDKRPYVVAIATAYIAGMEAQEELMQDCPAALKREWKRK